MSFFRTLPVAVVALLSTAVAATPIRDLTKDSLADSRCEWQDFVPTDDMDGMMVLYQGNKVAEWHNHGSKEQDVMGYNWIEDTEQHALFSVTKTFVSSLVGMLYRDGFLSWETEHPDSITLGDIFPDETVWDNVFDIPYLIAGGSKVPELKAITLGELMSMRTGYSETPFANPLDTELVRDLEGLIAWWHGAERNNKIDSQTCFDCGEYLPSTGILNYVILEKTKTPSNPRGWDPLQYAQQTSATLPNGNLGLFEALGMEEGSYTWDQDKNEVARAAYGLWADLEDMAKFGQLLLQGGDVAMDGALKVVLPSYYLNEMTKTQSRMFGSNSPMGWQVWTWGEDDDGDSGFCAEGLGFQSICVYPKAEMVVAIQSSASWFWENPQPNIDFRNQVTKMIRDGVVCSTPTAPPTKPEVVSTPGSENGNTGNEAGDNTTNDGNVDAVASLPAEKDNGENGKPVGLIVSLLLALVVIAALVALLFVKRSKNRSKSISGSIPAECKIISAHRSGFQDEDKLDSDDVSKCSVGTTNTGAGATYYVDPEDVEQTS